MAVSYLSKTIRSNPFIHPFDLDLMVKVNAYKQGEFYKNAAKAENMITQLNNADIANPEQRAYLKGKVNNLVSQLNNMGAINYSDANIANAIEGFGAGIYEDENVINGIASTKMMREWQNNVQKLKTDPKLSKYYNGANEAWDYEKYVKPYVNGGIGAKYEGPRAPKPYMGNPFTKVMTLMKELRPDIETSIDPVTGNQFFFSKTEKKFLSEQDISAALDGFIDGDTKQQLQIDAWYNYDYSTGNTFSKQMGLDIYTQDLDNALNNKNEELKKINEQIIVEPDINKKKQLEEYKKSVEGHIQNYTSRRGEYINKFSKEWDDDPTIAKYKLYLNRFQKDVIRAAGYSESKNSLIKNEERLFTARQQLEYTKNGLHWVTDGNGNLLYNSDGTPLIVPVKGAENMQSSGKSGSKSDKTPLEIANGIFHDLTINTETDAQVKANRVTEDSLIDANKDVDREMTRSLKNFIETVAKRGGYTVGSNGKPPVLEFKTIPESNKAASATISVNPLIEAIQKIGEDNLLTREDIEYVLKQIDDQHAQFADPKSYRNNYLIRDDENNEIGLTKEQVGFFRNMLKNWDAIAEGNVKADDVQMNVSPSEFASFIDQYTTYKQIKDSNTAYMNDVKKQALEGIGLTGKDYDRYMYFISNPKNQEVLVTPTDDVWGSIEPNPVSAKLTYTANPEWVELQRRAKIPYSSVLKIMKNLYANASNRLNYYSLYLPDTDTLDKVAPGIMNKVRKHSANYNGTTEVITPVSISRDGDAFKVEYTYGKGTSAKIGSVPVDAAEANKLGAELYPDQPLERLLTFATTTGERMTYSPAFKQPIKFSIDREGNDRNSRVFIPYIYYGGERIPIFATDKQGFQGSANAAKHLLINYINNYPGTIEQFIAGLKELAYNR